MKTALVAFALFCLSVLSLTAGPTTFEEFKQLSESERKALFKNPDPNNLMYSKYLMWHWRLQIGEKEWQEIRLQHLARAHGFTELDALFTHYIVLGQEYWMNEARNMKASMPAADLEKGWAQWNKNYDSVYAKYLEALHLYAALVTTPQAQALNKEAEDILQQWLARFPSGTSYTITPQQMREVDGEVQRIMTQLKALPKLTVQEAQTEIERLPDDHMR